MRKMAKRHYAHAWGVSLCTRQIAPAPRARGRTGVAHAPSQSAPGRVIAFSLDVALLPGVGTPSKIFSKGI